MMLSFLIFFHITPRVRRRALTLKSGRAIHARLDPLVIWRFSMLESNIIGFMSFVLVAMIRCAGVILIFLLGFESKSGG